VAPGAPGHQGGVLGQHEQTFLIAAALELDGDLAEVHLLGQVTQVQRPGLQLVQLRLREVFHLRRLLGRRQVDEGRRDLSVRAGELLSGQEHERLRVRVLSAVPDVGWHVAEIADLDVEPLFADELLAAALDVVLQRVAVGVVALGLARAPGSEDVQVVDVESHLRADDHPLVWACVLDVGFGRRHVQSIRLAALAERA